MVNMIRLRLLVARANAAGAQNRGDEIEVGAAEAGRMVAAGQAELLDLTPPAETTARRRAPKKRA